MCCLTKSNNVNRFLVLSIAVFIGVILSDLYKKGQDWGYIESVHKYGEEFQDCYAILDLTTSWLPFSLPIQENDIDKAYFRQNNPLKKKDEFIEIGVCYNILHNHKKRKEYDKIGHFIYFYNYDLFNNKGSYKYWLTYYTNWYNDRHRPYQYELVYFMIHYIYLILDYVYFIYCLWLKLIFISIHYIYFVAKYFILFLSLFYSYHFGKDLLMDYQQYIQDQQSNDINMNECSICLGNMDKYVLLPCNCRFCTDCMFEYERMAMSIPKFNCNDHVRCYRCPACFECYRGVTSYPCQCDCCAENRYVFCFNFIYLFKFNPYT